LTLPFSVKKSFLSELDLFRTKFTTYTIVQLSIGHVTKQTNITNFLQRVKGKPVYKGHSREPENMLFIYRLKLYALFINEKNETALYR
jgi:hypothetical protein